MNSIDREQFKELLTEANVKPCLKRELRFVPEEITDWGDRDFITVTNRSHSEGVIIAPFDVTYVVPFRLERRKSNSSGRIEAIICDICATWQRGTNSAVISIQRTASTVSFLCCADLLCSLHVRDKTPQAALSRTQLRENNDENDRIKRLKRRLAGMLEVE